MRERRSLYSTSRFHHEIKLSASCTFEMNLAQHFSQLLPLAVRNRNWRRFAMFWFFFCFYFYRFFGEKGNFLLSLHISRNFSYLNPSMLKKKGSFAFANARIHSLSSEQKVKPRRLFYYLSLSGARRRESTVPNILWVAWRDQLKTMTLCAQNDAQQFA